MPARPLSYSSVRTYEQCPLRWKLKYVDRLPSGTTPAQALGRGLHAAIEAQHRAGAETSASALVNRFEAAMREEPAATEALIARGRALLAAHHVREREQRRPRVLGVERAFSIKVEGVPFRGIVDRLEAAPAGVAVVDLKTGGGASPWAARSSRQLGFYQMGVEEDFGMRVDHLALLNLTTGERAKAPPRTREALDALRTLVLDTADAIDAEKFEPRLNADCPCEYASRCPFFIDKFPRIDDWSGEERARIAEVVDRYAVARARVDADALHEYMRASGVRRAWGRTHFVDRLRRAGRAWDLDAATAALGRPVASAEEAERALGDSSLPPRVRNALGKAVGPRGERWVLRVRRLDPLVARFPEGASVPL